MILFRCSGDGDMHSHDKKKTTNDVKNLTKPLGQIQDKSKAK